MAVAASTISLPTGHLHHRTTSRSPFPSVFAIAAATESLSFSSSSDAFAIAAAKLRYRSITLFSHSSLYSNVVAAASSYANDYDDYEYDDEEESVEDFVSSTLTTTTSPSSSAASGRLYVGNLPFSMTPSQLAEVFGQAGSVQGVEVIYDRVTDRSRGFAFVTMATAHDANEAIRMFNDAQMGGRTVKVNFPEVPRGGERDVMGPSIRRSNRGFVDSPYKVYAGNLGWSVTSESLRMAFAGNPGLLGARIIYDRDSGRSRGFGFVSFSSPEEAQAAIESMDAKELQGRPLRLSHAAGRKPPSTSAAVAASTAGDVM